MPACQPASRKLEQPADGDQQLVGDFQVAVFDFPDYAILDVVVQKQTADRFHGSLDGGYLSQDIITGAIPVDHVPDTADLAFNPAEPGGKIRLELFVPDGAAFLAAGVGPGRSIRRGLRQRCSSTFHGLDLQSFLTEQGFPAISGKA
jgi:hypothetical protein